MSEIQPFIACFPTPALLGKKPGFPEALRGVSLSRAYGDGLLRRDRGEALFRAETTFTDSFGQRYTRCEILGVVEELKNDKRRVVVENVQGAAGTGECSIGPPALHGIFLDSTEMLRQVLGQRRGERPILETASGKIKHKVIPIRAPEIEMVLSVLADMTWYVPVPGNSPSGRVLLSLANWYSTGTRFDRARFYSGDPGQAVRALGVLRKQLKDEFSIREYPGGSAEGMKAATMEAVEDLRIESGKLPAFAVKFDGAEYIYLFIGRRPLPKQKSGFFSLARPAPTRERVRKEIVEPVLKDHGLKRAESGTKPCLTLYLPASRPEEYREFGRTEHAATLDLAAVPVARREYVFPESDYRME